MGCNCGGGRKAGSLSRDGRVLAGFRLNFPAESGMPSQTFATSLEAKMARQQSGIVGSTIEAVYQ